MRLLGPALALEAAEDLTGLARGIGFQISEALGVLERAKVLTEMRSLDQEGRAALRKHGVRFGAYHITLPALLKPAPRTLAAQLWALQNGGLDQRGLDEIAHLAGSGRTSMPVDPEIAKGLYRAAGFRVCGGRAVRVDILERLADLIRPAIAYVPGTTPGEPPPGTADRDGFVATVGMTSLVGCSGEDFASILKSLGYVVDRRPGPAITVPLLPPPRPSRSSRLPATGASPADEVAAEDGPVQDGPVEGGPVEAVAAEAASGDETVSAGASSAAVTGDDPAAETAGSPAPDGASVPEAETAADAAPAGFAAEVAQAPETDSAEPAAAEASDGTAAEQREAAPASPDETDTAEDGARRRARRRSGAVRGSGGGGRRRGGRRERARRNRGLAAAPPSARPDPPPPGPRASQPGRRAARRTGPSRGRPRPPAGSPAFPRRPALGRTRAGSGRGGPRDGRPPRGPHPGGRPGEAERGGRPPQDRREAPRNGGSAKEARPPRRERAPDPDSPFAKLLALKAQMESRDGDKR